MPLTLEQKANVRRHMGYPVIGLPRVSPAGGTLAAGTTASYRYFQAYGLLEFRLNNLNTDEEARLLGGYYAALSVLGPTPNVGDTLTTTFTGSFTGSPVVITVTVTSQMIIPNPPDPVFVNSNAGLGIVMALAAQVAVNANLQNAQIRGFAPYSTGSFANATIPLPQVAFDCPNPFTMTVSTTGQVAAQIILNGTTQLPPYIPAMPGITTNPLYGYMPILDFLEASHTGASQNLDTLKADVWTARPTELAERMALYETWRLKLSDFLAIPLWTTRGNFKSTTPSAYL